MKLLINGQQKTLETPLTLEGLLSSYQLNPQSVVIERNRAVVSRKQFSSVQLEEGDQIEIVQFVGGGS